VGLKEKKESNQAQETKDNNNLPVPPSLLFAFFRFLQIFKVHPNLLFFLRFPYWQVLTEVIDILSKEIEKGNDDLDLGR
jgi:hypothetical protein